MTFCPNMSGPWDFKHDPVVDGISRAILITGLYPRVSSKVAMTLGLLRSGEFIELYKWWFFHQTMVTIFDYRRENESLLTRQIQWDDPYLRSGWDGSRLTRDCGWTRLDCDVGSTCGWLAWGYRNPMFCVRPVTFWGTLCLDSTNPHGF